MLVPADEKEDESVFPIESERRKNFPRFILLHYFN